MAKFIPGMKLSELFYVESVKPILDKEFPKLKYSAGLLGHGSEVLGFDTPRSTDHDWGPRLLLFLSERDYKNKDKISKILSKKLPYKFRGFSTHFGTPDEVGVKLLEEVSEGPINHRVEIFTMRKFIEADLHFDINKKIEIGDWLTFPEQKLLTLRRGKFFHDDLSLKKIQTKFNYYPKDIWLYLLLSQWTKIAQEEAFVGRCGHVKDELGSKIITGRLVRDLMRLCFLMEKEYPPYSKWFGTGFSRLKSAKKLTPIFHKILEAKTWKKREQYLVMAYQEVARLHNQLKITKPLPTKATRFHERPYLVINAGNFANEIKKKIKDPKVKKIKLNVGSIDQFTDSTDLLVSSTLPLFKKLYG